MDDYGAETTVDGFGSGCCSGLPITPAPSGQVGTVSGDLDLAPGAPITPAPSQALSSRTPSRAGSMPPAPPPTPAEVCSVANPNNLCKHLRAHLTVF